MSHLSPSVRGAIHQFAFWVANRSVGLPVLEGVDYACIFEEPSAMQIAFAVFANVLEVDAAGVVTNEKIAERRAAQWIREYCDETYSAEPPFEAWEEELP
jgi:hypothetical protein